MGYCMTQEDSSFRIAHCNKGPALRAVQRLRGHETCKDSSGNHFRFVDSRFHTIDTLSEMLEEWGWAVAYEDEFGEDIVGIEFEREKIGDELILFTAIAPYVDAGSFIEMVGEDGAKWRWCFDGKTCEEVYAETVWPE